MKNLKVNRRKTSNRLTEAKGIVITLFAFKNRHPNESIRLKFDSIFVAFYLLIVRRLLLLECRGQTDLPGSESKIASSRFQHRHLTAASDLHYLWRQAIAANRWAAHIHLECGARNEKQIDRAQSSWNKKKNGRLNKRSTALNFGRGACDVTYGQTHVSVAVYFDIRDDL